MRTFAALALALLPVLPASAEEPPRSRTFDFTYTANVKDVPSGAKRLDLWLPVPVSDRHQTVELQDVASPFPFEYQTEGEYGNRVLHAWTDTPAAASVTLRFRCTRRENRHLPGAPGDAGRPDVANPPVERFLRPDRLGVIDEQISFLASEATAGRTEPFAKSRALYDTVLDRMVYDKSGTGWGRGDTRYACEAGRGNCTDFHALFISLSRAQQIPARFEIGVSIPADKTGGPIAGYHCWAQFWLPDFGWVPVDASEASKNRDKREYFFGAHDEHRVAFTIGRDLSLPGMKGEPLNFLVYPYAEVDGVPHAGVDKAFAFQDVAAPAGASPAGAAAPPPPAPAGPKPFEIAAGDAKIRFYGFIRADVQYDDSRPNNTQTIAAVLSEDDDAPAGVGSVKTDAGDLTIHPRLTRFGTDILGPKVPRLGDAAVSGRIEWDFYNSGLAGQSESRAAIRMRHAYLKLDWDGTYVLAGQTADIISPLWPAVNADIVMWGAGNLGDRRPMLMGEHAPKIGPGVLHLQGELGLTGADDNQNIDGGTRDGEASELPTAQARIAWKGPQPWLEGRMLEAGVWGHYAKERIDRPPAGFTTKDFASEAIGIDLSLPLSAVLELRGEAWRGRNVDDIRGGIFQGISPVGGGTEIESRGGFLELIVKPLEWHAVHAGVSRDNPVNSDVVVPGAATVAPTGAEDNFIWYVAQRFNAGGGVSLGLDYLNWTTQWRGGLADGTNNRLNFFIQYAF